MRLKLKEDPKEWRNFILIACAMLDILAVLLYRKHTVGARGLATLAATSLLFAALAFIFPARFRPVYRCGMTFSFRMGQVLQTVLLTFIYLVVFAPLALVLRASGKDLLELRKRERESYWKEARKPGSFEQQF